MLIPCYTGQAEEHLALLCSSSTCPFCDHELWSITQQDYLRESFVITTTGVCPVCGWWNVHRYRDEQNPNQESTRYVDGAAGSLRQLNPPDIPEPLTEVRDYLIHRYEKRFELHPRLFERTVASVFQDLGYQVTLTAYTGDGGIDAILQRQNETIGVQVKRYRDSIEADQIRSFAGALVLSGQTRGIFVITSRFQKGASSAAELFRRRGLLIELTDPQAFFDKLGLAKIEVERSKEYALSLKGRQFTSLFWGGYL